MTTQRHPSCLSDAGLMMQTFSDAAAADGWLESDGLSSQKAIWMRSDSDEVYVGDPHPRFPHEVSRKDVTDLAEAIRVRRQA